MTFALKSAKSAEFIFTQCQNEFRGLYIWRIFSYVRGVREIRGIHLAVITPSLPSLISLNLLFFCEKVLNLPNLKMCEIVIY